MRIAEAKKKKRERNWSKTPKDIHVRAARALWLFFLSTTELLSSRSVDETTFSTCSFSPASGGLLLAFVLLVFCNNETTGSETQRGSIRKRRTERLTMYLVEGLDGVLVQMEQRRHTPIMIPPLSVEGRGCGVKEAPCYASGDREQGSSRKTRTTKHGCLFALSLAHSFSLSPSVSLSSLSSFPLALVYLKRMAQLPMPRALFPSRSSHMRGAAAGGCEVPTVTLDLHELVSPLGGFL
ncbi:hypothetical protein IF2G_04700 [Cordyceps javanica]|nr:hypothetical protein IF2G_04700 [Cordyceps javanica]